MTSGGAPDHLARNLDALRRTQPALAQALETVALPDGAELVTGRDGASTYLLTDPEGRRHWFGGSSMPTLSAAALMGPVDVSNTNVLLPAVATGLEPVLLAGKLSGHCAVFVHECDLAALRMAMTLRDLSALIDGGRLIILPGPDVESELIAVLREHPGCEFPSRIVPLAGGDPGLVNALKVAVEAAGRSVAAYRETAVRTIATELRARESFALAAAPRVAIISVDPRPETLAFAGRIHRAAQALNWPAATCLPDVPARCHGYARLATIRDQQADLVLTVNSFGGRIETHLNDRQPIASWFGPEGSVPAAVAEGVPSRGLHFASRPSQRDELIGAGVAAAATGVLETGADHVLFRHLDEAEADPERWGCDVGVLGDVANLDPQSHVSAESHVRIFNAIVQSAPAWAETYTPDRADAILARAERRCSRPLKEERIRIGLIELIRGVIAPSLLARLAVERLVKAGLQVKVWGRHWELSKGFAGIVQGEVPAPEDQNRVYNAASLVLCPFFTTATVQTVLDALAAGSRVLYRGPDVPVDTLYPQTSEVLALVPSYRRLTELSRAVTALTGGGHGDHPGRLAEARGLVLDRHTMTHRLESMRSRLATSFA